VSAVTRLLYDELVSSIAKILQDSSCICGKKSYSVFCELNSSHPFAKGVKGWGTQLRVSRPEEEAIGIGHS
jgi:hypothetical protein